MTEADAPVQRAIRLLVVDDHPAVREGLALLVSADGITVVAEAERARDAVSALAHCVPDLAVVDLTLEDEDGLDLVAALGARRLPVLVYSMHHDARHVQDAFAAGALGYVTKAEFRGVLVEAIRTVASGKRFVSPKAALALAEGATTPAGGDGLTHLSTKERRVYELQALPRILVVDDPPAVRRGLALVLEAGNVGTCIEAGCAEEALELAREARPDLAVVEMSGTPRVAFGLLGQLRALGIPVLIRSRRTTCPATEVLAARLPEPVALAPAVTTIAHVLRSRVEDWLLVGRATPAGPDRVHDTSPVTGASTRAPEDTA